MPLPGTIDRPESEVLDSSGKGDRGWLVTVYDNDFNTVDEVEHILIVATGCNAEEAQIETWEVHHLGRSVVHISDEQECQQVAAVITQIGIEVRVTKD
jgi:ATP-dependent Clp protease adapter protein ClpS